MSNELIKKSYIKVDDENFEIVEERKNTTNINFKFLFDNMSKHKGNLKADIKKIIDAINGIKTACGKYNEAIDDMEDAKKTLGYEYEVLPKIDYDGLVTEVLEDEAKTNEPNGEK